MSAAWQFYRNTTLGQCLEDSLDEMIQSNQITPAAKQQVLLQFDKAMSLSLAQRARNKVNFKGKIKIYRYCDNVWTFLMTNTEFRDAAEGFHADRVKIVACDGGKQQDAPVTKS